MKVQESCIKLFFFRGSRIETQLPRPMIRAARTLFFFFLRTMSALDCCDPMTWDGCG